MRLWPFKMRPAAGESRHAMRKAEDAYRAADLIYCSASLKPEAKAPFARRPIAKEEDIPTLAFHQTVLLVGRGFLSKA